MPFKARKPRKRYALQVRQWSQLIREISPEYKSSGISSSHQLPLFDLSSSSPSNGVFRDPAFCENKSLPVHRWVPWIAGFSATFVEGVCQEYLRPTHKQRKALILDPFAGVGTTLLQAVQKGHDAVGFEINPYAALAASTKLDAFRIDLKTLDETINSMQRTAKGWRLAAPPRHIRPPDLKTRIPFFSPRVERQILHAFAFISSIRHESIANLFRTAFGAVIVSVSNYSYEPSLGTRPGAGKPLIEDANVSEVLLNKLHHMRADIAWLQEEAKEAVPVGCGKVINGNFLTESSRLETASIDLMITSPPYLNNYHYVRNTRPQLYWLSFISSPEHQKSLETGNFGKFWQTVRDDKALDLEFQHQGLQQILDRLRETRKSEGAYGGPGWANYVAAYFNDCCRFLNILRRVLKRNGIGVIVIGNSIIQGLEIKVEQILGEIGIQQGLQLEGTPLIRSKRVGASITQSSVRRGLLNKATLYESAVILRKP